MPASIDIKFYTKPDCPLCDDAAALLDAMSRHELLRIAPVNILTDPALYDLYRNRIPVLIFGDGTMLEPPIRRGRLAAAIRAQKNAVQSGGAGTSE